MKINKVTGIIGLAMVLGLCACGQKDNTMSVSSAIASSTPTTVSSAFSTVSFSVEAGSESTDEASARSAGSGDISGSDEKDKVDSTQKSYGEAETGADGRKKIEVKDTGNVLIDTDGFYAEITDKTMNDEGYSWTVHCVNNTGNTVYFGMENVSVNGVMAVPRFMSEVEGGASTDTTATWNADLKEYGVDTPTVIEGKIVIIDKESYAAVSNANFTVCPDGEDAAYYVNRAANEGDVIILDNDYVNFISYSFSLNEYDEVVMSVFLKNKSDKDIILSIDGCFINDAEADPFWAVFLPAGKSVFAGIYWPLTDLQAVGIESLDNIKKIVAEISVSDLETYEVYSNEIVTLEY